MQRVYLRQQTHPSVALFRLIRMIWTRMAISEQESCSYREQRKAAMVKAGRLGLGNTKTLTFAQMDRNNNGQISKEELSASQAAQRGKGGKGMGQNR